MSFAAFLESLQERIRDIDDRWYDSAMADTDWEEEMLRHNPRLHQKSGQRYGIAPRPS